MSAYNGTELFNISKTGASLHLPDDTGLDHSNDSSQGYFDVDDHAISIAIPIVFALIFVVGLIGNGCVISAVLRYKSMRSAPNIFIVNLAVGDVLLILISLPTSALIYNMRNWPFGLAMCKISYFIRTLSLGVSIFTLTMLSIDRLLVISRPVKRLKTTSRITIMLTCVWIISVIVAVPDAISYHIDMSTYFDFDTEENFTLITCKPHPASWRNEFNYDKIHATLHTVLFFILPFSLISVCYGIMAYLMVKSSYAIPGESPESFAWRNKQTHTRKKVAVIIVVLIVLFFVCWLPRTIFIMVSFYGTNNYMKPWIYYYRIVAYCLQYSNCCVNPIALYFLSKSFKTHYIRQLCCGRDLGRGRLSETEATKQSHLPNGGGESQPLYKLNNNHCKYDDKNGITDSHCDTLITDHNKAGTR